MQKLSDILGKSVSKFNLGESSFSLLVLGRAKKHLVDFFGNSCLKSINPIKFKNGILTIQCKNSSWAQEVQLVSNELIILLEGDLKERKVLSVRVQF